MREGIAQIRDEVKDLAEQNDVDINRIVDVINKNSNMLDRLLDMMGEAQQSSNRSNATASSSSPPATTSTQTIVLIPGSSPVIPSAVEVSIVENASASSMGADDGASRMCFESDTVPTPTTSSGLRNNPVTSPTIVGNAGDSSMSADDNTQLETDESTSNIATSVAHIAMPTLKQTAGIPLSR